MSGRAKPQGTKCILKRAHDAQSAVRISRARMRYCSNPWSAERMTPQNSAQQLQARAPRACWEAES